MSSKIFKSVVAELIYVNQCYGKELLSQDVGLRLFNVFINKISESFPDLNSIEGKLILVFFRNDKNILSIEKQKEAIKITLNAKYGSLKDSEALFRNVSKVGHWGSGDYQVRLTDTDKFEYVLELVNQLFTTS